MHATHLLALLALLDPSGSNGPHRPTDPTPRETGSASSWPLTPPPVEAPAHAPARPEGTDNELHWFWKDGLRFETADQAYRFRFGGRIHLDAGWFSGEDLADAGYVLDDGVEFRRARMYVSGDLPGRFFFKTEYEFAGSVSDEDVRPTFTDVYLGRKDVIGKTDLQLGHFKEPFGLEQLTGANYLTFMERSTADALVPKRNTGAMVSDAFGSLGSWAVGVFKADSDDAGNASKDGGYAVTARATVAPLKSENADRVVHVGAAYSLRDMEDVRYRSRPEAHLVGNFVDTGAIDNDDVNLYGAELAGVFGPVSMQGEYVLSSTTGDVEADMAGWYVEASWFVTGEHRPYSSESGTFGRVKPAASVADGGAGAWQVAARYSSLDLDDGIVTGGQLDDVTLGVNWYLSPNSRIMLNYVFAGLDDGSVPIDDDASLFMVRFQVDW